MNPDNNESQAEDLIKDLDYRIRGPVIIQSILIENFIELSILDHFFHKGEQDERNHFKDVILNELSFSKKIRILFSIMKNYYPELFRIYKPFRKQLDKIRVYRNEIAHSFQIVTTESYDEKVIKAKEADKMAAEMFRDIEEQGLIRSVSEGEPRKFTVTVDGNSIVTSIYPSSDADYYISEDTKRFIRTLVVLHSLKIHMKRYRINKMENIRIQKTLLHSINE